MSKANVITTNFTAGEISPYMKGRVDTNKYANGAEIIENFLVRPQGGLIRRNGTYYIASAKNANKKCRLIPFRFSDTQAYVLEVGDGYTRFYKNGGQIISGTPVELATPWLEADLPDLQYAQSADILWVTHPGYCTRKITRTSDTAWSISYYLPNDGPYLDVNNDVRICTQNSGYNVQLQSESAATFVVGDVGKFVEFRINSEWRLATINTFTDAKHVSADVVPVKIGLDSLSSLKLTPLPQQSAISNTNRSVNTGTAKYQGLSAPQYSVSVTPTNRQVGVDPSATVTLGGAIVTSSLSGTFTKNDVGKYIRLDDKSWRKITVYTNSTTVTTTAVTLWADSANTWPTKQIQVTQCTFGLSLIAHSALFVASDGDSTTPRLIRLNFSGFQMDMYLLNYVSSTVMAATKNKNYFFDVPQDDKDPTQMPDNCATNFRLGAWSISTGWPRGIALHEQRLWFGGTSTQPQTIWSTETGDYNSMSPTAVDSSVLDTNGITYTIASGEVNVINWMQTGPVMLIGTNGAEFQAKAASAITEPITPRNISVIPQTTYGSQPGVGQKRIGTAVLFCDRSGRRVREMVYDFQQDQFVSKDLTVISEHILRDGGAAAKLMYQQNPNSIVWILRTDGTLAALTYEREQEVVAWHRHIVAGTNAVVESICAIPDTLGNEDVFYMVVRRTVNGATVRYVEYMLQTQFPQVTPVAVDRSVAFYVDAGLSYSGAPATTITGLTHLVGETVKVLADGKYVGTRVVNGSGQITLTTAASVVQAGLGFRSKVKLLPPEGGSIFGTSQGKNKRMERITARLLNAVNFLHGDSLSSLQVESLGLPSIYFAGDIDVTTNQGYNLADGYWLVVDDPYPIVILAVMPMLHTNQ